MIVGLLVAAGHGRRFDPTGARSKLEVRIGGVMVAVRTAQALLACCDRVIAAVRPESTNLADELAHAGCEISVIGGEEGMGNSIACAARQAARHDALRMLLVQPADMPWLEVSSVRRVVGAEAGEGQPNLGPNLNLNPNPNPDPDSDPGHAGEKRLIVLPTYRGRDGHPVRFDRTLLAALSGLTGDRGARPLLMLHPPLRIAVDDPGVVRDLDTPDGLDLPAGGEPDPSGPDS